MGQFCIMESFIIISFRPDPDKFGISNQLTVDSQDVVTKTSRTLRVILPSLANLVLLAARRGSFEPYAKCGCSRLFSPLIAFYCLLVCHLRVKVTCEESSRVFFFFFLIIFCPDVVCVGIVPNTFEKNVLLISRCLTCDSPGGGGGIDSFLENLVLQQLSCVSVPQQTVPNQQSMGQLQSTGWFFFF